MGCSSSKSEIQEPVYNKNTQKQLQNAAQSRSGDRRSSRGSLPGSQAGGWDQKKGGSPAAQRAGSAGGPGPQR